MSFSRAVTPTASCHACNTYFARTLVPSIAANGPAPLRASWAASRSARRQYTITAPRRVENPNIPPVDKGRGFDVVEPLDPESIPKAIDPATRNEATKEGAVEFTSVINEETATVSTSAETTSSQSARPSDASTAPDPSIPWYLRTQQVPTPSPEDSRALIPELPKNPPPLLQTLLEYISITAGLDDLHLLDLRHLDPPPALGPKLIMIIGTARSEKHLHVSADRFCRYLRREHGLKANAAGLLGRNELKIKLRRKAKRMKMLANVGGREPEGNIDDGIRTGWICCTIGKIEPHPEDTDMPGADVENFVGFRDVKPGVNLVVQMFTEEKRAEIDLERLWGGVLKTHERKDGVAEDQLRELEEHLDGEFIKEMAEKEAEKILRENPLEAGVGAGGKKIEWKRPKPSVGDVFPPASESRMAQQVRRLHTVGLRPTL